MMMMVIAAEGHLAQGERERVRVRVRVPGGRGGRRVCQWLAILEAGAAAA